MTKARPKTKEKKAEKNFKCPGCGKPHSFELTMNTNDRVKIAEGHLMINGICRICGA